MIEYSTDTRQAGAESDGRADVSPEELLKERRAFYYGLVDQIFGEELYRIYYRFLETEDEYFDYAPAPVPPQGRWRIYGLGLPDQILRKVYNENATRLLNL